MTPKSQPKTTRKPASPRRADGTLNALCKALGLSKRRVSELLSQGMPDDPQAALAWRDARENDDSAAALRRERIKLVSAQRVAVETANMRAAGELVLRSEVEQCFVRIASANQAFLRKLEKELPQICLGLTLTQSMPLVRQRTREIQDAFSSMADEFWKTLPTDKA
jgi:hypothetical protein